MSAVYVGGPATGGVNTLEQLPKLITRIRDVHTQIDTISRSSTHAATSAVSLPPPFSFHGSPREITDQLRSQTERLRTTIQKHQTIARAAEVARRSHTPAERENNAQTDEGKQDA